MSTLKIKTYPDLSLSSKKHQDALLNGKEHFFKSNSNVEDRFKGKSIEEIKSSLKETHNSFAVCFEHFINDFNIATSIRNANAFNAKEVFYIGNKKIDKRGCVGTQNYTDVNFLSSVDDLVSLKKEYVFVGVDNIPGSVDIQSYCWKKNSMLIFGEEGVGLTEEMQKLCDDIVHIPMFGSVRSFNCGTASGIAMYDYIKKRN